MKEELIRNALYVVATPLGNLGDITLRAIHILKQVDAIACEDTRATSRLTDAHGIRTRLFALHQHNERDAAQQVIALLREGKAVALVSDAGTPGISDPGSFTVRTVRDAGLTVIPLPGACAATAALSAAGLPGPFRFVGFLPEKTKARATALAQLGGDCATLVFYEAPHRIVEMIEALTCAFGTTREVVIARELTKLFETIHHCLLGEASAWLQADANRQRGEFVVLLGPPLAAADMPEEASGARVLGLLVEHLPIKTAIALTQEIIGPDAPSRNALYEMALSLKSNQRNTKLGDSSSD